MTKGCKYLQSMAALILLLALLVLLPAMATAEIKWDTIGNDLSATLSDEGVFTISGSGAMWDKAWQFWDGYRDQITSVVIEDGVTSIGNNAFDHCANLTSVMIGDGVTSIGQSAFDHCESLTSVTIPDSVTSIGNSAFDHCTSLTSVTIPDSVTSIGQSAFGYCTGLTSVTIGKGVTSIGNNAFDHCTGLTSVTIPDGVTSIGQSAFGYCTSLTSVMIPDSVTSIGNHAFDHCTNLTSVTIGSDVTSIGYSAFGFCEELTHILIPASVQTLGASLFTGCDKMEDVYACATEAEWKAKGGAIRNVGTYHFIPEITTSALADGQAGESYSQTLDANVYAPVIWSLTGAPQGLVIDPATGEISGTLAEAGVYSVTITARDENVPQELRALYTDSVTLPLEIVSAMVTPPPSPPGEPTPTPAPTQTPLPDTSNLPRTGDDSRGGMYLALAALSMAALAAMALGRRRA